MTDNIQPPFAPPPVPPPALPPFPPGGDGDAGRTGPPWEDPGPLARRFAETAQAALLHPTEFFRTMRRTGGIGKPVAFGLIGTILGGVVGALYQLMMSSLTGGFRDVDSARAHAFVALFSTGCIVIVLPLIAVISMFVSAAINHVMLLLLGGARRGFETTMRVVAYSMGSTGLLNLVPFCGGLIGGIWSIVIIIIGLAEAHEISTGKSALAVLLPVVICCVLVIIFYAAIFAMILGGAFAGAMHR